MDREPSILDPDGRYRRDGTRLVDLNAERVLVCAPDADVSRTRDVIQLDFVREDIPLTAIVTSEALELRLPTLEWLSSSHYPTISSRLCKRVLWKTLGNRREDVDALIAQSVVRRRREHVACRFCRKATPPERRHGRVCHSCAEGRLGVVH